MGMNRWTLLIRLGIAASIASAVADGATYALLSQAVVTAQEMNPLAVASGAGLSGALVPKVAAAVLFAIGFGILRWARAPQWAYALPLWLIAVAWSLAAYTNIAWGLLA